MGSKCFKKKIHPKESREDLSPPVKLPTVKKQSIVRTTDDMPMNRLFLPLQMNKETSNEDSNTIERQNSNNLTILPPKTPRTIIHTSSLQKRRNSEVFIRKMKLI